MSNGGECSSTTCSHINFLSSTSSIEALVCSTNSLLQIEFLYRRGVNNIFINPISLFVVAVCFWSLGQFSLKFFCRNVQLKLAIQILQPLTQEVQSKFNIQKKVMLPQMHSLTVRMVMMFGKLSSIKKWECGFFEPQANKWALSILVLLKLGRLDTFQAHDEIIFQQYNFFT